MKIRIYTAIQQGLRERQEDALCFETGGDSSLAMMAVADGMGGHPRGNEASAAAVRTVEALTHPVLQDKMTVRDLMHRADEAVTALSWVKPEHRQPDYRNGPGSTLTAAFINGPLTTIGHIGDSRAYVFRKGALRQITRDHGYGGQYLGRLETGISRGMRKATSGNADRAASARHTMSTAWLCLKNTPVCLKIGAQDNHEHG